MSSVQRSASLLANAFAVRSIAWLDGWHRFVNGAQTTLMPCPRDVIEPVKLVASMVNSRMHNCTDAIRKVELLGLQKIVKCHSLWKRSNSGRDAMRTRVP